MTLLTMSSRSSVDRAPARCSGGHGFDSCRGLRIFLCPTLASCWLIHLHISLPSLKFTIFINLSLFHMSVACCRVLMGKKHLFTIWVMRYWITATNALSICFLLDINFKQFCKKMYLFSLPLLHPNKYKFSWWI